MGKKRNNSNVTEVSTEFFKKEIGAYHRDSVYRLLKKDILDQVEENEKEEVYKSLILLKDLKIVDLLAKRNLVLKPEWFDMDFANHNNYTFTASVLEKYRKKFDLDDEENCKKVFRLACAVNDQETLLYLIRQKKASSEYHLLGSGSDGLFTIFTDLKIEEWDVEQQLEFVVGAAMAPHGMERIDAISQSGFDFQTKNIQGKKADGVMTEKLKTVKYPKNRSGELKKAQDQNVLKYLRKLCGETDEEKKTGVHRKKYLSVIIIAAVVLVIVGIWAGASCGSHNADSGSSEAVSEDGSETGVSSE